jgi:hypothetical protein
MPNNATIYIADPSLLGSKLFGQSKRIRSYEGLSDRDSATGLKFQLDAGKVVVNFMPEPMMEEHLPGFCGYAQHVIAGKDRLVYAIGRIRHVRLVLGCTINSPPLLPHSQSSSPPEGCGRLWKALEGSGSLQQSFARKRAGPRDLQWVPGVVRNGGCYPASTI